MVTTGRAKRSLRVGLAALRRFGSIGGCLVALGACAAPSMADADCAGWPAVDPSYSRPYGPNAPWNVPVAGLPRHPESEVYVERLWHHAPSDRPGNVNLAFDGYTYPVYDARTATGLWPIWIELASPLNGQQIPWDPLWQPAAGSDGQAIILDPDRGLEWNLWRLTVNEGSLYAWNGNLVPGDYRTGEVGYPPSRGAGIPYLAMLVRPQEIVRGDIGHALSMPIRNTDGAVFVPPATKLEHPHHPADGVPEGMRFALDVTDREIDQWAAGLPTALGCEGRRSAIIIARALRDYGWFVTDTGGGASLQFEDRKSAGTLWDQLGLGDARLGAQRYPRDLLDGLLRQDRIFAVVPSDRYPSDLRAPAPPS